ncbi:hypothetical protein E2I00_008919 [Balaenoptera physalus]|uniref:Protein kinase domain-containing protein n=1 Tax=Balaenoptera physalus TaxID=9770 RepID=A0A6A1PYZ4_BALPH|nr:hypothetical protein E2I00_008919 [Balaenoptera physalus]
MDDEMAVFAPVGFLEETASVTVDNVLIPEHDEKGILFKSSISFHNIIEGTKNFHKDFLIGEGEIFEVYRVEIQNRTYAIKLFKQGDTAPLSWHIRISILIGTTKAVQYLHNTKPCSVICGSISRYKDHATGKGPQLMDKEYLELIRYNGELVLFSKYLYDVFVLFALDHNFSANILLDDQFQPKLTDFAMAHIRPHLEPQSSVISMTSNSSKHLWYMPEEYIRQGKLSVKTDVYSFGIVIMEVLTGCKVVLDEPKHIQLRDLLIELLEKRGLDSCISFLDKKVHPCPRNFSAKLFSLAGQCAATRAKLRPSMDEVLTVLESTQASLYFAEDPPTSLKSFRSPSPLFFDNVPSIPVEDDENQNNPSLPHDKGWRKGRTTQKTPFECSQSEVTFLGFDRKTGSGRNEDICNVPSSPCEESWSPKHAAPSQDLRASGVNMDPSAEVPGHSYRSMPVETSCSSEFSWNECEQYKKASISPEDKEES